MMNARLVEFLRRLSDADADEVCLWLDGGGLRAIEEAKEVVANSHTALDIMRPSSTAAAISPA